MTPAQPTGTEPSTPLGHADGASIASSSRLHAQVHAEGSGMANITVRNLDDEVQRRLKRRAATHGRSMEAEARAILTAAVTRGGLAAAWVEATAGLRGDDVPIPPRSAPRAVDLG